MATLKIATRGSTLTFSIPRRALGQNTARFRFLVAAGREAMQEDQGGGADYAPARGSFRYVLTGSRKAERSSVPAGMQPSPGR